MHFGQMRLGADVALFRHKLVRVLGAGLRGVGVFRRGFRGGGRAETHASAGPRARGTGAAGRARRQVAAQANSCRTRLLTKSEASSPQAGRQTAAGFCAISGVTSKAYLAPQEHWIFILGSGSATPRPGSAPGKRARGAGRLQRGHRKRGSCRRACRGCCPAACRCWKRHASPALSTRVSTCSSLISTCCDPPRGGPCNRHS